MILIIPDVHGRTFWQTAKEKINEIDKVIFLGDYLDPYPHEGITPEEAIVQFKEIIQFKKDNPDKVVLLLGNHDCAYCYDFGSASRYDYQNESEIKQLFKDNIDLFQLYYVNDNCLYSHAGITNDWLKQHLECNTLEEFLKLPKEDIVPHLWVVSFTRGGWSSTGSMIWSDVREFDRNEEMFQIFGHTQLRDNAFIQKDKFACLDVRKCFMFNVENKEFVKL